jgi:hypothetical protein
MIVSQLLYIAGTCPGQNTGLPNLYNNLCNPATGEVQLSSLSDIYILIGNIIQIVLAIAGALALIFILVSALYYVISTGDPGRIKRAKDILSQAITGLIIVLVSYAVIVFISSKF